METKLEKDIQAIEQEEKEAVQRQAELRGATIEKLQDSEAAADRESSRAPAPFKIWMNFNNEMYAAVEPKSKSDALVPGPSRNLYDSLVSQPGVCVNIQDINESMAKHGNGENSAFDPSGIII